MRPAFLSAAVILLALSACGGGTKDAGDERKTAAGEVLGGSISDDMLPLATVQSQSPPLRESAADEGEQGAGDEPDGEEKRAAPAGPPAAQSSAPAPEASALASPPAGQP